MTTSNNSTRRRILRKKLLSNGYRPLPLVDKGIRIPGWTRAEINQEWIDQFTRNGSFPNTGIRCDDLVAYDIDVLDEKLADDCEEIIEDECGYTDLCRVGAWPKRLLLYRLDGDLQRSARTGKYGGHMVELLSTPGRQFAAFGLHPGVGKDYEWLEDISPENTPYSDLPAVSGDLAVAVLEKIDDYLAATGLPRTTPGGRRGIEGVNAYDLTDDTELLTVDGELLLWGKAKGDLDSKGLWCNLRREDGEFGDSDSIHAYLAKGLNQPCLHDFARDITRWDVVIDAALGGSMPPPPATTASGLFVDKNLSAMLDDYVLLADKTVRHIDHPEEIFAFDGFKLINSHLTVPRPTPNKPNATVPLVDAWKADSAALRADRAMLRPDRPGEALLNDGKLRIFNTYNPPLHALAGGEVDTVREFVEHLIPDERERELFLDWHALKVAHPEWRMHGLVTVTPAYGTGRGIWFSIIEKLFGVAYARKVSLMDILGDGSQAQYNQFLAESLIVYVPEALEEKEGRTRWQSRHLAYERLKELCEPAAERTHIKRKYGKNSTEYVYSSLLLSTNHDDALAIPEGDRRLIILDNTRTPLVRAPGDLQYRIVDWLADASNIDELYRWFDKRASTVSYKPFEMPPTTAAKDRMVEESQSDIDRLFDLFAGSTKGDICTHFQWRAYAYQHRLSGDLDLPIGDKFEGAIKAVLKKRGRRIIDNKSGQLKVDGAPVRPWLIRFFDAYKGNTEHEKIRAEIRKNGPAGGSVAEFPHN